MNVAMIQVTSTLQLETELKPTRVGQRLMIVRQGAEDAEYIRTFCGNRWGWINLNTGECIDTANVAYAMQRGAAVWVSDQYDMRRRKSSQGNG